MGSEERGLVGELDERGRLVHELRNTLFATDMLLEHALELAEGGDDPSEDVRRAREGLRESLDVIKRHLHD